MFESKTSNTVNVPTLEALEPRQLMSAVINISPGYQDATSAIQNALNSAGGGGTVNLAPGSYNISSQVTIPSGVKLEGGGKATLNWSSGSMGNMLYSPWNSNGTTVDGVTFNGAGYKIDPDGSNLTISNNTFENNSQGSAYYGNGLYIPDVESNSKITGNTFNNITGNVGIYIFNSVNVQITNNKFNSDGEGIKGQWFNGGSNDVISNNTLNQIYRFGIECQGNPTNLTVDNNYLANWQQRNSHIGLSIATGEGNGITIDNNTILGSGISNPSTAYTAIEAMGNNLTIAGNYGAGWGWAQLVGYTNHWVTENNTWGVNTAVWVDEAGGTAPAVNSGNVSVPVNDFNGPSTGANGSTAVSTYTSAPTSTPTTTSAPTTSTSTTTAPTSTPTNSSSLPSGWNDSNIGNTGKGGAASYSNGVYTVAGAGSQVWGNADSLSYAYQTVSTNSSITARVTGAQFSNGDSETGLMVRSSLNSNASDVLLSVKGDGYICLVDRANNSGSTVYVGGLTGGAPVWLRLAVSGNTVKAYYSTNGSSYNLVGTVSVSLSSTAYAGLAMCSANTGAIDTATFDNVSITG
jgi:regulation of enolase protein 1 (concanavalin A-like superfamily)